MYEPYVRPQENNHRTDIYWCTLTSKAKEGLLFVADRTFEMNVSNYPLESLDSGDSIENGAPAPPRPITATSPTRKPNPRWISL